MCTGIASLKNKECTLLQNAHPTDSLLDDPDPTASNVCPAQQGAAPSCYDASQGQQQLDMEGIKSAFSPIAIFGIRSLPDALHPGYRMELLSQLQMAERRGDNGNSPATCSGHAQHAVVQPKNSSDVIIRRQHCLKNSSSDATVNGRVPLRYGPMDGYFSCYRHITSEYERRELVEKFARLNSRLAQVGSEDFVVRGCPLPSQHTTTFATYHHDLPPYVEVDFLGRPRQSKQQHQCMRPFIPAGRSGSPDVLLKGQMSDLLSGLNVVLSVDWPRSFIKAFVDQDGCVVLSFDRAAAACEGDLTSYLNHQERHGSLIVTFRLAKDPNRWGVVEADAASVFYVLIPPWCKHAAAALHPRQSSQEHL